MPSQTIDGPLGELADALGGVQALGEALGGTDPSTIWRWANLKTEPYPAAKRLVFDLCEANGIAPPEWARFRRAPRPKTWSYQELTATAERAIKAVMGNQTEAFCAQITRSHMAYGVYLGWVMATEGTRRKADEDRLKALTEMPAGEAL